jgi:hypothetical protein
MSVIFRRLLQNNVTYSEPSHAFSYQWQNPGDVFSVLLILGGDVVTSALAQLTGTSPVTPVAFSFGWVAYATAAVVSAVGDNKLMPLPDCTCKVINGKSGYVRDNGSWIIGRIVRDYEYWQHGDVRDRLESMLARRWVLNKEAAEKERAGSATDVSKPMRAGLCVSIYKAGHATAGRPSYDRVYFSGFATAFLQLGIAAITCGLYGDWSILLITASGILLAFATGSLPQWEREKWACRRNTKKSVLLTRGNGAQHVIAILGEGRGLDLEDLAASPANMDVSASYPTRIAVIALAMLWIALLITAAGITQNTWFLLAVGGIGILQNVYVAGVMRRPEAFGVPITFDDVIGEVNVMETLFALEGRYPRLGKSLLETFFPGGKLRSAERERWAALDARADALDNANQ